jgi:hypothetical protein
MTAVAREGRAPQLAGRSRGLLLHLVALGVLVLGTAALALARVDGAPGTLPTAVMLVYGWAPQARSRPAARVLAVAGPRPRLLAPGTGVLFAGSAGGFDGGRWSCGPAS